MRRSLTSLLGAAMLLHQVGGFFGAWLGGVAVEHSGGYVPLWITDVALAAIATGLQLVLVRIMTAPRQRRFALAARSVSRATA